MRQVIATFNMTLDGVCDHTTGVVDEGLHQHYTDLIGRSGTMLYGRITYGLMKYWQTILENPTGIQTTDDFAHAINRIPKVVFSTTLQETGWDTAEISDAQLQRKVLDLKGQPGGDILVGSRSLIVQLLNSGLIDQLQLCVHPIIEGSGIRLFDKIDRRIMLKLAHTKTLGSGATIFYYEPVR